MITVGLVRELYFIVSVFKNNLKTRLEYDEHNSLTIVLSLDANLDVYYNEYHIWHEKIEGAASFFGIESCDTIARIIYLINHKEDSWKNMTFGVKKIA